MAYQVTKRPWLGAFFVLIFGSFGFLYYSWRKALITFLLFFLPNLLLYNLDSVVAESIRWIVQIFMAIYAYLDINDQLLLLERIFEKVLPIIILPIMVLNFSGEIGGGIWLIFLGQWKLVLCAFLFALFVPYAYLIVGLIQMPILPLLIYAKEKNKKFLALSAGFISTLIGYAAILGYVFIILDKVILFSESKHLNIFALFLFGYGIATAPFSYMASKDGPDALGSFLGVFVAQISYIIFAVAYLFDFPAISIPIILIIVFGIEVVQLYIISKEWFHEKADVPSENYNFY